MSKLRQDPSDEAELAKLLQKKQTFQKEREALELRIEEIDHGMIEIQAKYGAIYNKRASVLKLPTEVTCMIFSCAAGYPMEGDSENGNHLLLEVTVSHVCRQWRSISLAFPQLWANFSYDGPKNSKRVPLDRSDAYFERSSSQPLEMYLNFRGGNVSQLLENSLALLEKTLSRVARWKCVTILSDSCTPLRDFLPKLDSASAPILEHFAFCCGIPNEALEEIVGLQASIFTNGAPNLTSVMLDCSSDRCLPSLSNVTTLRLEAVSGSLTYFSWSAFIDILLLPYLTNLSLSGEVFEISDNPATFGLITMNNLKHFRYSGTERLALFLPYFRAPLLETLVIQNNRLPEEFGVSAELYVFPSLQSVSLIETTAATPHVALHFARMTESATEILFSQVNPDDLFMSLTTHSLRSTNFWTKVKLHTCNSRSPFHMSRFITFARDRPKNDLVLRIFDTIEKYWKDEYPDEYDALAKVCTIEAMDSEDNPLVKNSMWPPGEYNPAYSHDDEDPFDINPL